MVDSWFVAAFGSFVENEMLEKTKTAAMVSKTDPNWTGLEINYGENDVDQSKVFPEDLEDLNTVWVHNLAMNLTRTTNPTFLCPPFCIDF